MKSIIAVLLLDTSEAASYGLRASATRELQEANWSTVEPIAMAKPHKKKDVAHPAPAIPQFVPKQHDDDPCDIRDCSQDASPSMDARKKKRAAAKAKKAPRMDAKKKKRAAAKAKKAKKAKKAARKEAAKAKKAAKAADLPPLPPLEGDLPLPPPLEEEEQNGNSDGLRRLQSVVAAKATGALCPSAFPYAYQDGKRCCASFFDFYGDALEVSSRTCEGAASQECTNNILPYACSNAGTALKPQASPVNCGGYSANNCRLCPLQGVDSNGSNSCNADCRWEQGECVAKECEQSSDCAAYYSTNITCDQDTNTCVECGSFLNSSDCTDVFNCTWQYGKCEAKNCTVRVSNQCADNATNEDVLFTREYQFARNDPTLSNRIKRDFSTVGVVNRLQVFGQGCQANIRAVGGSYSTFTEGNYGGPTHPKQGSFCTFHTQFLQSRNVPALSTWTFWFPQAPFAA